MGARRVIGDKVIVFVRGQSLLIILVLVGLPNMLAKSKESIHYTFVFTSTSSRSS
jgi:hypothetical protein